jgi:hypothetical protein
MHSLVMSSAGQSNYTTQMPAVQMWLEFTRGRGTSRAVVRIIESTPAKAIGRRRGATLASSAPQDPCGRLRFWTKTEASLDAVELESYRLGLDRLLTAHEPFAGLVLVGHGSVVAASRACVQPRTVGRHSLWDATEEPARERLVLWASG